ncbi:MAG: hypothetical protein K8T20_18735 [Planctomycetes bacterium]|nr:hypothetical protein [Planctomycetota bacterium]
MKTLILAAASIALAASSTFADVVLLKNGGRLVGATSESEGRLVVRLESGTVKIPMADVLRVIPSTPPAEEYATRAAALTKDDVKGHLALAAWCAEAGLPRGERTELEAVIAADPENADARARLGYEKVDNQWLRGEALLLAKGMVKVDGRWVTKEEAAARTAEKLRVIAARREAEQKAREAQLAREAAREATVETWVLISRPAPRVYHDHSWDRYGWGYYDPYYYARLRQRQNQVWPLRQPPPQLRNPRHRTETPGLGLRRR